MWKKLAALVIGILISVWVMDDFDPGDLKGKRVVLTGASSGIGEQMAYQYARHHAKLLITARREVVLRQVVAHCREVGDTNGEYYYVQADMSNLSATEMVIKEAEAKLGGIDFLVLNHIHIIPMGLWNGSAHNLTMLLQTFNINFRAYVHLTSHALPLLEKTKGSIIVLSSIAGKYAQPYLSAYSASKYALDGFFTSLRQELKLRNCDISITLCVIGLIGTENAIKNLKDFGKQFLLTVMVPAKPVEAATAIIRGGLLRTREMYFPYFQARMITLLRDWIPDAMDKFSQFIYS